MYKVTIFDIDTDETITDNSFDNLKDAKNSLRKYNKRGGWMRHAGMIVNYGDRKAIHTTF